MKSASKESTAAAVSVPALASKSATKFSINVVVDDLINTSCSNTTD
jgi:hypothetical protein